MGELLIDKWRLAVLRVRLDLSERMPAVAAELVGYPRGRVREIWRQGFAPEEFGISSGTGTGGTEAPRELRVPEKLCRAVTDSLRDDFSGEAALWLRLVRPYGHLGAVPWEEMLVSASNRPLVRVPDRLPVAGDPGYVWSLAVALNAPPDSSWAPPYLSSFLTELNDALEVPVEADVFADAATYEAIRSRGSAWPRPLKVHLHDPSRASDDHAERNQQDAAQFRRRRRMAGSESSPRASGGLTWADWITSRLEGRAVRALYVVSDAFFDVDRPLLAISPDPGQRANRGEYVYVTADGVQQLADIIGASSISFGSPPSNPSDIATRVMADGVGQLRPGPTFYSSLRLDPEGFALARAHAFIADPRSLEPIPQDPSLFAYLQPEHVQASLRQSWQNPDRPTRRPLRERLLDIAPGLLQSESVDIRGVSRRARRSILAATSSDEISAHFESAASVPGWVAASERYIDANVVQLVETASLPKETPTVKQAYDRGTVQALNELRDLVERNVRES